MGAASSGHHEANTPLPDRLEVRDSHGPISKSRVGNVNPAVPVQAAHNDEMRIAILQDGDNGTVKRQELLEIHAAITCALEPRVSTKCFISSSEKPPRCFTLRGSVILNMPLATSRSETGYCREYVRTVARVAAPQLVSHFWITTPS